MPTEQTFEPMALVAPLGAVVAADNSADTLNAAQAAANAAAPVAAAPVVPVKHAGDVLAEIFARLDTLEAAAVRIADIEQKISPILHLVPGLGALAPIADELASIVENLNRGRVRV